MVFTPLGEDELTGVGIWPVPNEASGNYVQQGGKLHWTQPARWCGEKVRVPYLYVYGWS